MGVGLVNAQTRFLDERVRRWEHERASCFEVVDLHRNKIEIDLCKNSCCQHYNDRMKPSYVVDSDTGIGQRETRNNQQLELRTCGEETIP